MNTKEIGSPKDPLIVEDKARSSIRQINDLLKRQEFLMSCIGHIKQNYPRYLREMGANNAQRLLEDYGYEYHKIEIELEVLRKSS